MKLLNRQEMPCQEFVELVTDYFEGALPRRDRRRFERHVDACPHCAEFMDQLRLAIAGAGRLRTDDVSPEARTALLGHFRDWSRAQA